MFAARFSALLAVSLTALALPGLAQNTPPVVSAQIPDLDLYVATPANVIDLNSKFSDADLPANTVRLDTDLGLIDITLYDQQTPITVDNFLHYIDSGVYLPTDPNFPARTAPIFFHRSSPGFVIQSGGYIAAKDPVDPPSMLPGAVTAFSPIPNEARPDLHNDRGTIAMAKLPDEPDSATSQWFINLGDNGGYPNDLDTLNGGFTVFGTVSDAGMDTADAVAALPLYNLSSFFGGAFNVVPLRDYDNMDFPTVDNLVLINTIERPLVFTAVSDHPGIATATVAVNDLLVEGVGPGTATITVTATDGAGAKVSQSFGVTVTATPVHVANISTRVQVGAGDDGLIGGFILRGDAPKRVLVRAIGPSLTDLGVTGALQDPVLELHDGTGALISSNDNWGFAPNKRDIMNTGLAPTKTAESAILTTLSVTSTGSAYTAIVHGSGGTTGVGLVEVYDLDSGPGSSVLNISTRADVQTGDNVMIGGFIVAGTGDQQVLVRAIGPSLGALGIANPLGDPTLTLYDSEGTQIDSNDNWPDSPDMAAIEATMIPPNDPLESAVLPTLAPGAYTAIVSGANGTTGTGLVEVYALTTTAF